MTPAASIDRETTLLSVFRLVRLPNVFSAAADVLAGYWIVQTDPARVVAADLFLLILASGCLYCAGMVFNDVFDREVDAIERPSRPLPAGAISLRFAIRLGVGLLVLGVAAAGSAGPAALAIAVLLVAGILGYDGVLKKGNLGPPAMGLCRALNVLLGMSPVLVIPTDGGAWPPSLTLGLLLIPLGNGIYIAGVTGFARQEAERSSRRSLAIATFWMAAGLCTHALGYLSIGGVHPAVWFAWAGYAMILGRRLAAALVDPSPEPVQSAVKTAVLGLIAVDAGAVLAVRGPGLAAIVLSLLAPSLLLGRWFRST